MEQNQQGLVDLLEIYHARQIRDDIMAQLRRIRRSSDQTPLNDEHRRHEIRGYYEALLLTVAELLQHMGDDDFRPANQLDRLDYKANIATSGFVARNLQSDHRLKLFN